MGHKFKMKDQCFANNSGIHEYELVMQKTKHGTVRTLVCKYCKKEQKL